MMLDNSQVAPTAVERDTTQRPAGWPARWSLAGSVLRRHWLAAVLLAAGLALRVLAELAYRPALFLDATRYLYNSYGSGPS